MWRSKINLLGQKYLLYSKNEEIERMRNRKNTNKSIIEKHRFFSSHVKSDKKSGKSVFLWKFHRSFNSQTLWYEKLSRIWKLSTSLSSEYFWEKIEEFCLFSTLFSSILFLSAFFQETLSKNNVFVSENNERREKIQ